MKFAVIENGKVTNVVVSETALEPHWLQSDVAAIGDDYINGQFITPAADTSIEAAAVRQQRDILLSGTDWRVCKAAEVGSALDPAWIIYRQALREVPQQAGFPTNVTWPEVPEG